MAKSKEELDEVRAEVLAGKTGRRRRAHTDEVLLARLNEEPVTNVEMREAESVRERTAQEIKNKFNELRKTGQQLRRQKRLARKAEDNPESAPAADGIENKPVSRDRKWGGMVPSVEELIQTHEQQMARRKPSDYLKQEPPLAIGPKGSIADWIEDEFDKKATRKSNGRS